MSTFGSDVDEWARKIPGALVAIRNGAAQDVVQEMQTPVRAGGRMRVKTGFLWNSLMGSTSMMPRINPAARPADNVPDNSYSFEAQQIELVILGAELTDTLYFGYTAAYAGFREYEDGFVRLAAQNWRQHVAQNARKVRADLGL